MTEAEKRVIEAAKKWRLACWGISVDTMLPQIRELAAAVDALTPKPDLCDQIIKNIWDRPGDHVLVSGKLKYFEGQVISDELRVRGIPEIESLLEDVAHFSQTSLGDRAKDALAKLRGKP